MKIFCAAVACLLLPLTHAANAYQTSSVSDLRSHLFTLNPNLQNTYVFFDIDETLVYPKETPFIHGLPTTDKFIKKSIRASCVKDIFDDLKKLMEKSYYDASIVPVDSMISHLVVDLIGKSAGVFALTARSSFLDENIQLLDALQAWGFLFSGVDLGVFPYANVTRTEIGTIFWAGGKNKAAIIQAFLKEHSGEAILIDNHQGRVRAAASVGLKAIHFTGAYSHGDTTRMHEQICEWIQAPGLVDKLSSSCIKQYCPKTEL